MVNSRVFRWPKPLFFMVVGAHGIYSSFPSQFHDFDAEARACS